MEATRKTHSNFICRVFTFYYEGFRAMTWGRVLWLIILLKLFIMFAVLKLLFFPNFLNTQFTNDHERASYVGSELIERSAER